MGLRVTLLQIAVLASTGCSPSTPPSVFNPDGKDASGGDSSSGGGGGSSGSSSCGGGGIGGCGCPVVSAPTGSASPAQACQIAQGSAGHTQSSGPPCDAFCGACCGSGSGGNAFWCELPPDYVSAYNEVDGGNGDAGQADGGSDAGHCPAWSGDVVIGCAYQCIGGRGTAGVPEPEGGADGTIGSILAGRAYLEAVSVHAFARLERELATHGAPPALLRDARRARRDEIRHTAMMARLARRYAAVPRPPETPSPWPVRSLFAIAMENAVEGCVRETYGAVVGLVEARASSDHAVRRAMQSIAVDECRHAELAWAVAAWIRPRLTPDEREAIERATEEAAAALARDGDARIVGLMASRVWRAPSGLTGPQAPMFA